MATICKKCGCEVPENSIICMNCGTPVPDIELSQETKERLEVEKNDTHVASNASSTRALGATLLIGGIVTDVLSMFMISSGSYGSISTLTIVGTVCFLVGLLLFSNG